MVITFLDLFNFRLDLNHTVYIKGAFSLHASMHVNACCVFMSQLIKVSEPNSYNHK